MFKSLPWLWKHLRHSDRRVSFVLEAGLAFAFQVAGVGMSYVAQVLLARWLGASEYGRYTYLIAWASLLSVFASLGFPTAVLRFVPEYLSQKKWSFLRGLLHVSGGLTFVVGLAISTVLAITISTCTSILGLAETQAGILVLGIWLVPILALVNLNAEMFKGFRRIALAYAPQVILRPVVLVVGAGVLFWSGALTAKGTVGAAYLSLIVALIVQVWLLARVLPDEARLSRPAYDVRLWMRVSLPLLLISGYLVLLNQMDVIMIGLWLGPEHVGIYNAAAKTAALVSFVLVAVNAVLAPMISSLYTQGRRLDLQRILYFSAHGIFWPSLLMGSGLVLFGKSILRFFGPEFVDAYPAMVILVLGQLVNASAGSVGYLMNLTGHQHQSARVYGWSALVNVALNAIGIPFLGVTGAAIATAVTMALWNVWLHWLVVRNLGVYASVISALFSWLSWRSPGR